uniref:Uncharacterized protein n=1 Tax=Ciona intestinalis TaxID=7719 RepID=H2Y1E9_CIOIN
MEEKKNRKRKRERDNHGRRKRHRTLCWKLYYDCYVGRWWLHQRHSRSCIHPGFRSTVDTSA